MPNWDDHTREEKVKVLLLKMLESANDNHASAGEKGEMQEHFHTHWEVLHRLLHRPGKPIKLQNIYNAQALVNTFFSENINFLCTHKYPPFVLDANFDLNHSFPSSAFCDQALAAAMGKRDSTAYSQLMLRCGGSQPGFDAVTFKESVSDGLIALNIECRYSTPTTKGIPSSANRPPPMNKSGPLRLTLASVFSKYRHTMNCYEKLFATGPTNTPTAPTEGIRQGLQNLNHVFFVMAAFRDLSFELPPAQPTTETRYTMEDLIAAINTIESNHRGYKRNILSALNKHGHSCTSLDAFLSLRAGKELPADPKLFAAFLPPRVLVLDRDRLTALYGPSLASRPAFLAHQAEEESTC
ncbi:hypothetical protein QOT17_008197 [Balamuthia mandrillaris]